MAMFIQFWWMLISFLCWMLYCAFQFPPVYHYDIRFPYVSFCYYILKDNYFEEALKMRNLLEEFNRRHGLRQPTILGVREHVFTGRWISSDPCIRSSISTWFVYSLKSDILGDVQCFVSSFIHVQSRNQLCDFRSTCSCEPAKVSQLVHDIIVLSSSAVGFRKLLIRCCQLCVGCECITGTQMSLIEYFT